MENYSWREHFLIPDMGCWGPEESQGCSSLRGSKESLSASTHQGRNTHGAFKAVFGPLTAISWEAALSQGPGGKGVSHSWDAEVVASFCGNCSDPMGVPEDCSLSMSQALCKAKGNQARETCQLFLFILKGTRSGGKVEHKGEGNPLPLWCLGGGSPPIGKDLPNSRMVSTQELPNGCICLAFIPIVFLSASLAVPYIGEWPLHILITDVFLSFRGSCNV